MCDFLLLNKDNWMDALTPAQLAEYEAKYPKNWTTKYNARNGRYDIIECKPDGFFQDHQHGGGQFIIVHVPGLSVEEGLEFCGAVYAFGGRDPEGNEKWVLQHKNKARMRFANLPANIKNKLNKDFVHTVTLAQWASFKTYLAKRGIDIP
ncbi:MAG: hypothetical protein EHM49_00700 [Deltaproteobacteria bacterium]|nr:MAG: hypothetical protein EHM49_00700 [Deltaproteobacteria bacterium]